MARCTATKRSGIVGFGRRCVREATKPDGFCTYHRAAAARQAKQDAYWRAENERFAREHPNPPCVDCQPDHPDRLGRCAEHHEIEIQRRLAERRK